MNFSMARFELFFHEVSANMRRISVSENVEIVPRHERTSDLEVVQFPESGTNLRGD